MNIAYFIKPKSAVSFVFSNNTVRQVVEKMKFHGHSAIPVLNSGGEYVGTVTEGDLLWATYGKDSEEYAKVKIKNIIKPDRVETVSVFSQMDELLCKITEQNFVPVVDANGYFMGIVTRRDVMKYYNSMFNEFVTDGFVGITD